MSNRGAATDTRDGRAEELPWELAMTAQSCAYLAEELQIAAGTSYGRTLTCHDSTYRRLLDSVEIFRALLDDMRQKFKETNVKADLSVIHVLNARLAEEIRCTLVQGSATTTVECMTSTESRETSNSETVGDTR